MILGFKNVNIVTLDGIIKGNIEIKNGKITNINTSDNFSGLAFNEEVYIVPGFIDEHIHGVNGSDTMDGNIESIRNISKSLVKEGTTSFLATTMTQSDENINKALKNVNEYINNHQTNEGATVLGVHLEGPFINFGACGAQPSEYIVNPSVEKFKEFQNTSGNNIKLVTIAPEVTDGYELIKYCKENNIVPSIGHTKAKYEDVIEAIKCGSNSITHCFNAVTPLHHREVGVVGAALLEEEIDAELIVDGIHVTEKAVLLLYKNKGANKITLITDSIRAKGLTDGTYDLGGQNVTVKSNKALLDDGTLAGSVLSMIDAVKNMIKFTNISLVEVVKMASTNPAKKLGVFDKIGSIEINKDADLVVLNKDLNILMTLCKGNIVYKRG